MSNLTRSFSLVPVFGDLEKEFNRMLSNNFFDMPTVETSDWQPRVDIVEQEKQIVVKVDVPGVDPKDIKITIDKNALIIKGEKETEHKDKKDNFIRYERSKGSFYRRIILPDLIDLEKIAAKSKHGVLEITLPKTEKTTSRNITVEEQG